MLQMMLPPQNHQLIKDGVKQKLEHTLNICSNYFKQVQKVHWATVQPVSLNTVLSLRQTIHVCSFIVTTPYTHDTNYIMLGLFPTFHSLKVYNRDAQPFFSSRAKIEN